MAKTPDEMIGAISGSLAERTGRTLDEWMALVQVRHLLRLAYEQNP